MYVYMFVDTYTDVCICEVFSLKGGLRFGQISAMLFLRDAALPVLLGTSFVQNLRFIGSRTRA